MKKSFKELLKGCLKPATSKKKQKEEEKAKEIEVTENVEEEIIDITEEDKNLVWAFNAGQAGNDFRGNPKYLFVYVNKYRKDITAYWLSGSEETTEYVRNLGYRAYTLDTLEADRAIEKTGVLVAEQVKIGIPKGMRHVKYLNLYHGVGAKDVERVLTTGGMAEGLAHKYILHNQYYRDNQLFLCPSPMMVDDFKRMCGVDEDKVVRAGYPRNIYQKYFEPITTFDHDILKAKGLDESYKIAVYAPTYRQALSEDTFHIAIPDIEKLIEVCKRQKLLFVFKMHPVMENEYAYLKMKEKYDIIGDVRGIGGMLGVEFVKDKESKEPNPEFVKQLIQSALQKGLLLENAGSAGNVIRFLAPLCMTDEQMEAGLKIFEDAIIENL